MTTKQRPASTTKVLKQIHNWASLSQKSGVPKSKLTVWYTRNTGGFRDACARPDLSPPLFLDSEIMPVIKKLLAK